MFHQDQSQFVCSSLVEISDGKGRPQPRKLVLTTTHLIVQKVCDNDADSNRPTHGSVSDRGLSGEGSFDSFVDTDTPPPEFNKREVTLTRAEGNFGLSVRGGAEHQLPLIISRLTPNTPAALSKQIYIGDAIIQINGVKITKLDHDEAVEFLNSSGPTVTLKLKYIPTAKTFLSPTHNSKNNLLQSNLTEWTEEEETYETERSIPLLFALLSRFLGGTDRLRCNAFEVRDSTGNSTTGIIHCGDAFTLTSWAKAITDAIIGLNNVQMKLWSQETQSEIYYVGWVWEGESDKSLTSQDDLMNIVLPSWLSWKPKILAIRADNLYYMDYPPGVGSDWDGGETYSVITSLLRVLTTASEHLDERQHCFTLQIAEEQNGFPPMRQQPSMYYLSTETRQELIKVESAWTKAVTAAVKSVKKCGYPVWWGGKPCQLELDLSTSSFSLYRSSSKPTAPLWSRPFSGLKGSSDDSRTRLTLKFHCNNAETMECRDLHRILFTIHSFLLAKVLR